MTREEAIAYFKRHIDLYCVTGICREAEEMAIQALEQKPCEDCISRQAVRDRLHVLVNEMEAIFSDIREKNVDDSVCGLCEYDCDHGVDGYANECPGFERDDCFKLKDEYRKEWESIKDLPSVKPEAEWIPVSEKLPDEKDYCLCCDKDGYITIGFVSKWSKQWCFDDPEVDIDVIAWMPLPEPYKAESEDKK